MQLRHGACGVPHAFGDDRRRIVTREVEQRFQRAALDVGHHEERWDIGRIARVFPQHRRYWHDGGLECAEESRLAQHVTVADRLETGRGDLHHDAIAVDDRRVREARRTTSERRDVVGTDGREPCAEFVDTERQRGHVRSIASHDGWMRRQGRVGHRRESRTREVDREALRRRGRDRGAHRPHDGPRRQVRRVTPRDARRDRRIRGNGDRSAGRRVEHRGARADDVGGRRAGRCARHPRQQRRGHLPAAVGRVPREASAVS